jgi:glycosyltransferase involved in cell wall biosynthesis
MLPISFLELGYSSVLICGEYTLSDNFGLDVYKTFVRNKKILRSLVEPIFAFHKIFKTNPDVVIVAPFGSYLFSIIPLIAAYRVGSVILGRRKTKFILKTDWSIDFYGQKKITRLLASFLLIASTYIFDRVAFETYCGVARAKELPMIKNSALIRVPIGYPHNIAPIVISDVNRENIILCVARITPMKGQEILLKAFASIATKHKSWSLRFVGPVYDEIYKKRLEGIIVQEKLEQKVSFSGYVSEKGLYDELSRAKIFCLPSIYLESAGQVKFEATAAGLPVITTDVPCRQDAEEIGWSVCKAGDVDSMVKNLDSLISEPDMRNKIVDYSRSRISTYKDIAAMYIDL